MPDIKLNPYEVHLDLFEGPLDLLLFLIKKNDLNIYDIPISSITQEYLSYLDMMKDMNLDMAGEFLVLAATLMGIKAKTLLPSQPEEGEEGPDPRAELVAKLVEYQKFKQAADFLDKRSDEFKDVFYRGTPRFDESEKTLNLSFFDLMSSLREILDRAEDKEGKQVHGEEYPIEEKMEKILALLDRSPLLTWEQLFESERKRRGIISCFLAILELIKLQKIFVRQDAQFAKITIFKKTPPPAEPIWPTETEQAKPENGAAETPAAGEPNGN
jgi:segregation and condensation protein A